jgi:hypothetical protein
MITQITSGLGTKWSGKTSSLWIFKNLDNTDNSYKLKCNIGLIKESVNKFFTAIQKSDIIDIEYEYKKDKAKSGKYTTKCSYIFWTTWNMSFLTH